MGLKKRPKSTAEYCWLCDNLQALKKRFCRGNGPHAAIRQTGLCFADIESDVDLAILNKISEVADTPAVEVFACSPDESIHEMFLRTKRIAEILPAYRYGRARLAQIKGIK